jgi:hypothetical protein
VKEFIHFDLIKTLAFSDAFPAIFSCVSNCDQKITSLKLLEYRVDCVNEFCGHKFQPLQYIWHMKRQKDAEGKDLSAVTSEDDLSKTCQNGEPQSSCTERRLESSSV